MHLAMFSRIAAAKAVVLQAAVATDTVLHQLHHIQQGNLRRVAHKGIAARMAYIGGQPALVPQAAGNSGQIVFRNPQRPADGFVVADLFFSR